MKILIVDDDAQSRYLLERFLASRGHEVWSAEDGVAALGLCDARGRPDAVLSDALMPRMDGFELCNALRQRITLKTLPYVMYTATYTDAHDERFALSVGVDRFVVKPIEPEALLEIIEEAVDAAPRSVRPPAGEQSASFWEQHSRLVSVKLEQKLAELSATNAELGSSERSVRELNAQLVATIRRLEQESAERQRVVERLRLAERVGGVGSWEVEPSSEHGVWSEQACQLLGLDQPSRDGFLQHVHPEDHAKAALSLRRHASGESVIDQEVRYKRPGAEDFVHFLLRGATVELGAGQPHRVLTLLDVTRQKAAEAQRHKLEAELSRVKRMESLGNLAGGIAHDFNNLLSIVFGNIELSLLRLPRDVDAETRTLLREVLEVGGQAKELIRQILLFSRKETVERRTLEARKVVADALRLSQRALPSNVRLVQELGSDRHIFANEGQLHQVLLNLCTNAAYAMRAGGGTLTVRLESIEITRADAARRGSLPAGGAVRLDVCDTGTGIEPAVQERLFEPFFTTKPSGEGSGLGLAVIHGIVRSHEGSISVDSQVGRGTTFSVFFRAVDDAPQRQPSMPPLRSGKGRRVLVVDDEPSVARATAQMLEQLGYVVEALTDPREARERFAERADAFDVAVLDYMMPGLNGEDLAKALWELRPRLPIVLMASFGSQMDTARARERGFREVLAKPFSGAAIGQALGRALASD